MFQFGRGRRYARGVRIAQIDVQAEEFYSASDIEIGLTADAAAAVDALVEALQGRKLASQPASWSKHLAEESLKNQASLEEQMNSDASPINQYRLFKEVRDLTPRDATIVAEGELTMGLGRITLSSFLPRRRLNAGTTGCMGTGVGYALGAKLARPDAPVIAVLGDYAFGAAAMEVETAVRNDIRVVFVVNNNEGIVGHNLQDMMFPKGGAHRIAALLPARYDRMVEMVGGHAENVTEPGDIRPALERAIAADRVALVNVMTDPKGSRGRGSAYLG
jgi:thiamine pyrophosphate-dependent acetolactate synthase large subunit-like protein